jgi:hypothetical protein
VRIKVTKPPLLTGACHCTGCQTMSASAYSLTLTVPADGFSVTQGEPVVGGLHGPVSHHFHCPHCMNWMFTRAEGFDWFVNVRPSMLDDHRWFTPFVDVWTDEKLPWAETGAAHAYPGTPEMADWEMLMKAFEHEGARPF